MTGLEPRTSEATALPSEPYLTIAKADYNSFAMLKFVYAISSIWCR